MKIGILTVYFADCGSFCHTTSLYKYLEKQGHSCEIINESLRYKVSKKLKVSNIFYKFAPEFLKKYCSKRIVALKNYFFLKKELQDYKISPKCRHVREIEERYDCIIIASDELWSCTNKNIGYIPDYYGIGISKPHFSYSTSGIGMEFPNERENDIKQGLMTLKEIAVRDEETSQWVERLTGRHPKVVLDPALFFPYYKVCENVEKQEDDYIIVYGEHYSEEQIVWMRKFAANRNYRISSVIWRHNWCDSHIDIQSFGELQQAFAEAVYCMTSTFHGTIFAIVNHLQFTAFLSSLRGKKVERLLHDLGLYEFLYTDINYDNENLRIDYKQVDDILNQKRRESGDWLIETLSKIERGL